ncbi:uncharacterized protein LALA0_S08e01618g [Lachancea lanzarotensis]|uniref:LALA0S08e01618g1_1 n=1 Tax=Lachancea lanzarotensis TaxID=1245769 RepID=A0A0C7NA63_9SACH|nr:uncharacterized protein LALA0_S08e01618g [Lachancea lanzarotensis]CEP63402.1 LALA0S08e01618g1_1 [Lachancea lanzarotensis]
MDYRDTKEQLIETKEGTPDYKLDYGPLPRDTFISKLSWRLEVGKWTYATVLLTLIAYGTLVMFGFWIDIGAGMVVSIVGSVPTLVLIAHIIESSEKGWNDRSVRSWMVEIININPGEDLNKWDLIAAKLNIILHENGETATRYYFYDGRHCLFRFTDKYATSNSENFGERSRLAVPFIKAAVDQYMEHIDEQFRQVTLGSSSGRVKDALQDVDKKAK